MAEIFPINREDDGQTQLQEKNGVVSAVSQPTYPAINIPDVITQDFFNRPPSADRQRIENDLQQRRQEYLASFQQTAREQQLQQESMDLETELSNLRQSEQKGLLNIEQQRIAMPLITGQQAALQRQAQLERGDVLAQLESKQKALGFEFAKREGVMAKAKAALGFAETDLERIQKIEENQQKINQSILDYSLKLSDNAQQVFGAILKQFDGMGWDQLSPEAQAQLAQTATRAGVPTQVLAEAMNAQKDQKDIELKKQELEFEKMQGDIKQQQFSQELAVRKFEEDKRQFGVEYALKVESQRLAQNKLTENDDDKPLNILDVQRYNELYPGAGVKAGDSATTANKKVTNAKTPETDLKNMISLAKDNGNSYDIIVNEINNDPSIMDKETAIKIAKDIFGIEPVTTKGGLPDLGKLNPVEYLSNSIYNFLFK